MKGKGPAAAYRQNKLDRNWKICKLLARRLNKTGPQFFPDAQHLNISGGTLTQVVGPTTIHHYHIGGNLQLLNNICHTYGPNEEHLQSAMPLQELCIVPLDNSSGNGRNAIVDVQMDDGVPNEPGIDDPDDRNGVAESTANASIVGLKQEDVVECMIPSDYSTFNARSISLAITTSNVDPTNSHLSAHPVPTLSMASVRMSPPPIDGQRHNSVSWSELGVVLSPYSVPSVSMASISSSLPPTPGRGYRSPSVCSMSWSEIGVMPSPYSVPSISMASISDTPPSDTEESSSSSCHSPYARRPANRPKSSRQQFSACGACRMHRVRCDLKGLPVGFVGPHPACSKCKQRGIKCVVEFADVNAAKLLRRGRRLQQVNVPNVGHGQGLIRLLQFSSILAQHDSKKNLDYKWWQDVVQEYFHPASVLKFTLWRNSQRVEAKPFEIGVPILPRFFLVTMQSGVKSMSLSLDGARERFFGAGHSVIECVHAQWTYRYTNGYCVVLRGPLTVHVIITDAPRDPSAPPNPRGQPSQVLKFEDFQFDANAQEKFISVDNISGIRHITPHYQREVHPWTPAEGHSPSLGPIIPERQAELDRAEAQRWEEALVKVEEAEIPGEPVNAFGIPQATMRCLELAESVTSMADLITYSEDINARSEENPPSAMETLSKFATKLRDSGAVTMPPKEAHPFYLPFQSAHESIEASVGQTLEPMALGYVIYPDGSRVLVKNPYEGYMLTRAGGTTAHSSPDKQQTTVESQPPQTPSVAASPAISSTTNNTPALASATLKRKNPGSGEATSPVVDNQVTAGASGSKPRVPRKRNRTQGA